MAGETIGRGRRFSVVFFKDDLAQCWVGQCLEHDFSVQAETLDRSISAFKQAIIEQTALDQHFGVQPFSIFKKAPEKYALMFAQGTPIPKSKIDGIPAGNSTEIVEQLLYDLLVESKVASA